MTHLAAISVLSRQTAMTWTPAPHLSWPLSSWGSNLQVLCLSGKHIRTKKGSKQKHVEMFKRLDRTAFLHLHVMGGWQLSLNQKLVLFHWHEKKKRFVSKCISARTITVSDEHCHWVVISYAEDWCQIAKPHGTQSSPSGGTSHFGKPSLYQSQDFYYFYLFFPLPNVFW